MCSWIIATLWLEWKHPYFKHVNCLMRPNFPTSKPFGHLIGCPIFKEKTAGHFVFFKFHLLEIFLEINAVFLLLSHKFVEHLQKSKLIFYLVVKYYPWLHTTIIFWNYSPLCAHIIFILIKPWSGYPYIYLNGFWR